MYSNLNTSWADPITHERLIHSTKVQEIFYTRMFLFVLLVGISIPLFTSSGYTVALLIYVLFILIFYPYFIKPWEIILSNKRLILRYQYWNIGRFSTLISFNLNTLDTQQIAPRFKLIPVTVGFTIITAYSLALLEFYLTGVIPSPLLIRIVFLIFGSTSLVKNAGELQDDFINAVLTPFKSEALFFSFISLIPAIALIIFGLPRRKQMMLSTTGGHQLSLSTGIHQRLTDMLFAVGRKHRVKESSSDWKWGLPLLDGEEIKAQAQIGLIERKAQVIGLMSLILFIDSLDRFFDILINPNFNNFILFLLKILELLFIWFAFVFAKKYRRIIAITHRLLYQEELRQVSGLWGKRIYQYRDFPYKFVKGFTYSNFSAIQVNAIIGILILVFGISASTTTYETRGFTIVILTIIIFYGIFNYKNFTTLRFSSIGGGKMELFYKLPVFMVNISHRLEKRETLYHRFFPNILNENDVADLCNLLRNVTNPKDTLEFGHQVGVDAFISKNEKEFGRWHKVGQFRFSKGSVLLGTIFSIVATFFVFSLFESNIKFLFALFATYLIIFVGFRLLVQRFRTLLLLKNRLFFTDEILPQRIAQVFGILPERSIQEQSLEYVLASQFRFTFGKRIVEFVKYLLLIMVSWFILKNEGSILQNTDGILKEIIIMLAGLLLIGSIIPTTKLFFENLPKYSLIIFTRFGKIIIPFMRNLDEFNEAITNARNLK